MTNHQQFLAWIAEGKLTRIRFCLESNSMKNSFLAGDMEDYRFAAAVKNNDPTAFDWAHMNMSLDAELINVNGIMVPAAEKKAPQDGVFVYIPAPASISFLQSYPWESTTYDMTVLSRGLVHLSAINAKMHAKAMLGNSTIE